MPFYLHYSNNYTDLKDCITFENGNGVPYFCHLLYFKEKTPLSLHSKGKGKTFKIKSLQHLFTEIVWHTTGNSSVDDVFSIYESLLSKYGFALLKKEFSSEKFNQELIDNVEKEINYLIADAMAQMPIDYPEDNSIDSYNEMYFGGMSQDELDTFRDNIE